MDNYLPWVKTTTKERAPKIKETNAPSSRPLGAHGGQVGRFPDRSFTKQKVAVGYLWAKQIFGNRHTIDINMTKPSIYGSTNKPDT